jgi:Carboxypeptidase regulatory-like domain
MVHQETNMKTLQRLGLLASIPFLLASCKMASPTSPKEPSESDIVIPATTKHVSAADLASHILSEDSTSLVLTAGNATLDNLSVNDVLVSERGLGLLRKVASVSHGNGQIVVRTTQATITDAIQKGSVSFTRKFSSADTLTTLYKGRGVSLRKPKDNSEGFSYTLVDAVIWDNDGDPATTYDQIVANGTISIVPTLTFSMTIDNWRVKDLQIATTITEDLNLTMGMNLLDVDVSKTKEIYRAYLTPIVTFIGVVPIVLTPIMTVTVGADAKVEVAITSTVRQHAELTAGIACKEGQWSPVTSLQNSFAYDPPSVTATAQLKGYISPEWSYLLYGVVGPYLSASLYGELDADVTRTPWAILYAGIQAGGGVKVEVLSHELADYSKDDMLDYKLQLWQSSSLPKGQISGIVRDAATEAALSSVQVGVFKGTASVSTSQSQSDGRFTMDVPVGEGYRVLFSLQGYLDAEYDNVSVTANQQIVLEPVLQINQTYSGMGNISGTILNALDGTAIPGVSLSLRKGINAAAGSSIAATTTDAYGAYSFSNIPAGNYTVTAELQGFNATHFSVICLGGQSSTNQNATMSPVLNQGETRIVLTWGENPHDLDSHLTGPLPDGSRFHMYYPLAGAASPWPDTVTLDHDVTTSYGPETTTLRQQMDGVYRFSVHDYSDRNSENSLALSNSGAEVRVYRNSGLVASFNVPPNTGGTLWTVFEMNGNTMTPIDQLSYESQPSGVQKIGYSNPDLPLFRNLPGK